MAKKPTTGEPKGAKAPRKKKPSTKNPEMASPAEVLQQISPNKLKTLLRASAAAYKDGREIAGTLGQKIGQAVEHEHLHRKAFSTLRAMERMTTEKLAEYWDVLQYYVEISGIGARAASAPKMNLSSDKEAAADDEADGAEETTAVHDDKVHPFPARQAAAE